MKKPQIITIAAGALLTVILFFFVRITPSKKAVSSSQNPAMPGVQEQHSVLTIDTFLAIARKQLKPEQTMRIAALENSVVRGAVKEQQLNVYHQLARFWHDSANVFEPYAWYTAEAARLENSEKSLTFAAQQFLDNLQEDNVAERRFWKATQAKDLFERSLKINPGNDSAKIGLGACYLFGGISATPMEGILKIREVAEKDSTNAYAQIMLGKGSLLSGQYDKAISRFQLVCRLEPANLDAALLLADTYDRTGNKTEAINWYTRCIKLAKPAELKKVLETRIKELQQ